MKELVDKYLAQSWGIRILIFWFLGWFIGLFHRITVYQETKNSKTLMWIILSFFLPIAFIDLISLIFSKEDFKYCMD